ncbi:MAG: SEC-C domain-containing protein [Actinomycetota bacterium]|nr:SEC-C domain-containing protein [Actinomycetota bacterium]
MGKKSRVKQRAATTSTASGDAEVAPRQPCPCGSGRRYKHCHGRPGGAPAPYVARTFEGLPGECDWVALREFVPTATARLPLRDGVKTDREVTVATLLPLATPAVVRMNGSVWIGLQVYANHGDVSRDLAHTLELALEAEPGSQIALDDAPPPGPRLQDLVDPAGAFDVTVHEGFDFWVADVDDPEGELAAAVQSANDAAAPSQRLTSVDAAYWTRIGEREFVRWVLPYDENQVLDGFARLHAAGADRFGESGRLLGMFRAHGLQTPVWELPMGSGPEPFDQGLAEIKPRLDAALAEPAALSADERAARNGLANRQLTVR